MPLVLPTPDELANASWTARNRARRRAERALREYLGMPRRKPRNRRTGVTTVHDGRRRDRGGYVEPFDPEAEREYARQMLAVLPPDPRAASRRAALLKAIA